MAGVHRRRRDRCFCPPARKTAGVGTHGCPAIDRQYSVRKPDPDPPAARARRAPRAARPPTGPARTGGARRRGCGRAACSAFAQQESPPPTHRHRHGIRGEAQAQYRIGRRSGRGTDAPESPVREGRVAARIPAFRHSVLMFDDEVACSHTVSRCRCDRTVPASTAVYPPMIRTPRRRAHRSARRSSASSPESRSSIRRSPHSVRRTLSRTPNVPIMS